MEPEIDNEPLIALTDAALEHWRQGDCVVGEAWFVHRFDPLGAVSASARAVVVADPTADLAETPVVGFAVVSQTCDIARPCAKRPFLEVSPLVEVDEATIRDVERGRRPVYAFVPALADRRLVVDLDRTMTVEKPVVARWSRTPGWTTDTEGRAFARALARKRARFAFPDDFTALARSLQDRLLEKHDRQSDEGRALRSLHAIRVTAAPSWDAEAVSLMFWFIRDDTTPDFAGEHWSTFGEAWLKRVPVSGRFRRVEGQVVTLEDITAADYVNSDPLDLDYLSTRSK